MWFRRQHGCVHTRAEGAGGELVLIDVNTKAAQAHAEDILHATPFARAVRVVAGDYSLHAYVLGEHGDSEVLAWSSVKVGGAPIANFAQQRGRDLTQEIIAGISDGVLRAAYRIIEGKGATYFGIGAGLAHIIQAIRDNERCILTVSGMTRDVAEFKGTCLSLPRLVGAGGILAEFRPELSVAEAEGLRSSAEILSKAVNELAIDRQV
jgi:L-lactate dehydrogenase